MLHALQRRLQGEREEGFTLIELMVVVLIIAILIAIAIPTFLGARSRAQDRAAQSGLRNALSAAKTLYTDNDSYSTVTTTAMASAEASLTYQTTASTEPSQISMSTTATQFTAAAMSKSGTCFWVRDISGVTTYAKQASGGALACTGSAAATFTANGWG